MGEFVWFVRLACGKKLGWNCEDEEKVNREERVSCEKSPGAKVGWTDANRGPAVQQSGFQAPPVTATDVTDVAGTLFRSLVDRDALHVM